MKVFETIIMIAAAVYFLVYIILAMCTKKPLRTVLLNALCGIISLMAVNLTSRYTGLYIPTNPYTAGISAAGGIAGVVFILVLRLFFRT